MVKKQREWRPHVLRGDWGQRGVVSSLRWMTPEHVCRDSASSSLILRFSESKKQYLLS